MRAVKAVNDKGEELYFKSAVEADLYGFIHLNIAYCCKGRRKTHKGYRWSYITKDECLEGLKQAEKDLGYSLNVKDTELNKIAELINSPLV